MLLAPIVLFTYNRPWHTEQTLRALQQNELADKSVLYVYSDGAKANASDEDLQKIQQVRELVSSEKWCGEVHLIEREENWGLADNIVDGVTRHVNEAGKVIVLEDDIVTSKGFLRYMNDALRVYAEEEKVMHISGYIPQLKAELPETYFYNQTSCWGWGTWKTAWKAFESDSNYLLNKIIKKGLAFEFNLSGSYPFTDHLQRNIDGRLKTWAVKWHASVFLESGLCLHPKCSLVKNIGIDGSGENSGTSSVYLTEFEQDFINIDLTQTLSEYEPARKAMIAFNRESGFFSPPYSPITLSKNVQKVGAIDTARIIERYQKGFNIDVSNYFKSLSEVSIYQCKDTNYRFYYPFDTAGDGRFYEYFQQYDWYYMPWKWEHEQTAKLLKPGMKVLEVGCAKGDFLYRIQKNYDVDAVGLELNQKAAQEARDKGVQVYDELVQDHAQTHQEQYDIVCSFQVLEHIADVRDFIESQVACLKKGGKLVICVPNNDSFMKYDPEQTPLNMPPHHMGLWDQYSLSTLPSAFKGLGRAKIKYEPVQPYHKDWYKRNVARMYQKFRARKRFRIIYDNAPTFLKWRIDVYFPDFFEKYLADKRGHSVLAIYEKQ